MRNIVVLTGAGISAESGVRTFRDSNGLWEEHRIEDVATPEAWRKNRALVLEFYNQRRKQLTEVSPNAAHYALVRLEDKYNVYVVTQNVDDLHERAGSKNILHLHGELRKSRSTADPALIYNIEGWQLKEGDLCEKGSQLRPHIVWFGEEVPEMLNAINLAQQADVFIIIGTSLEVYPAAGLVNFIPNYAEIILVDPHTKINKTGLRIIREKAGIGIPRLVEELLGKYNNQ